MEDSLLVSLFLFFVSAYQAKFRFVALTVSALQYPRFVSKYFID